MIAPLLVCEMPSTIKSGAEINILYRFLREYHTEQSAFVPEIRHNTAKPETTQQGTGQASRADLLRALQSAGGVEFGPTTTPEQTIITLMRAAGGDSSSAPYDALVDRIVEPGGFQLGL